MSNCCLAKVSISRACSYFLLKRKGVQVNFVLLSSWHTQRDAFTLRYRHDFTSHTDWHTACEFAVKIASANENPLSICGEIVHILFAPKTLCISVNKKFSLQKLFVYTVHTAFEFTSKMGETLIDLVCQYPALWDKQVILYKDSNYKEAKCKEIAEILCLTKEDVMKKWTSLRDTSVRHKNIKSKSGMA